MGCGASKDDISRPNSAPATVSATRNNNNKTISNHNDNLTHNNTRHGSAKTERRSNKVGDQPRPASAPTSANQDDAGKGVAFNVPLDNNIDSILSKAPPKHLKRLEPLENAPRLSAEQLEEKLRHAEQKRKEQLEKKKSISRKSSSKLRNNLQRAQEFEQNQQVHQATELEEKLHSASKNREAKRLEMEEKKRLREERAEKVRERAKQMKQEENGLEFDVEKDENFNAKDDDSWLDGENNRVTSAGDNIYNGRDNRVTSAGDNIYNGRDSPHKEAGRPVQDYRGFSASTTDSHDYAFQRAPQKPGRGDDFFDQQPGTDDFFDS